MVGSRGLIGVLLLSLCAGDALAARDEIFALVVTNNRSLGRKRPDLQYADDDGARYHTLFRTVAPRENVILLTRFDAASRRLYPALSEEVKPPTRKEVSRALDRIGRRVSAARRKGRRTTFYFVFAGHGHVRKGKGFLELSDGRFGPDDVERRVLGRVKAHVVHLLLDSCNSFFVINPRRPGGKRWATPWDMTIGFSKRFPHVGVVLSTSAAGEVYEWSEIQSGIFSHEVRSGLSGAADADRDGRVSYDEIEAFVATANRGIKNDNFRPKVFVRGPWSKGRASLLRVRGARGRRLRLGRGKRRLWIRDAEGTRLIDLHQEKDADLEIRVPVAAERTFYVQERVERSGRPVLRQFQVGGLTSAPASQPASGPVTPGDEPVLLASLATSPVPAQGRGQDEIFEEFFAHPYGPQAYEVHIHERRDAPDPVFGISPADERRMRHYLGSMARADRHDRLLLGGTLVGGGAIIGALGAATMRQAYDETGETMSYVLMIGGGAMIAGGLYKLLFRSEGEKAYHTFEGELCRPGASAESVIARTEAHLHAMAAREYRRRKLAEITAYIGGGLYVALGLALGITMARDERLQDNVSYMLPVAVGAAGLGMIGLGVATRYLETPMERMLRLYREDPDLSISVSVAPVRGGAGVGVSGTF